MRSNYVEFPYRIVEKRRRRGKKRDCQCSACRNRPAITGAKLVVRKIRVVK